MAKINKVTEKANKSSAYYSKSYVGDIIMKASINYNINPKWGSGFNLSFYNSKPYNKSDIPFIKEVYKKEKINFYETKDDFKNSKPKYFWKNHDLDEYWSQYLYRDALLARGQYDEIRLDRYVKKYIDAVMAITGSDYTNSVISRITYNLSKLSLEEFSELSMISDPDNTTKSKLLPEVYLAYTIQLEQSDREDNVDGTLGSVAHSKEQSVSDFEKRIIDAFSSLNKKYEYIGIDEKGNEVTSKYYFEDTDRDTSRKIDRAYKRYKRSRATSVSRFDYISFRNSIKYITQNATNPYAKALPTFLRYSTPHAIEREKLTSITSNNKSSYNSKLMLFKQLDNIDIQRKAKGKSIVSYTISGNAYIKFLPKNISNEYIAYRNRKK